MDSMARKSLSLSLYWFGSELEWSLTSMAPHSAFFLLFGIQGSEATVVQNLVLIIS